MSISATWIALTERPKKPYFYFRRYEMYSPLEWPAQTNLADYIVAICPYGGPVALLKAFKEDAKSSKKDDLEEGESKQQQIKVYTSSGILIKEFAWKIKAKENHVIAFGWTDDMKLVLVTGLGEVAIYNVHGERLFVDPANSQLKLEKAETVSKCQFWGQGVAIFTSFGKLFVADNITKLFSANLGDESTADNNTTAPPPTPTTPASKAKAAEKEAAAENTNKVFKRYPTPGYGNTKEKKVEGINCLGVIPPEYSCNGSGTEIILCPEDPSEHQDSIFICTEASCEQFSLANTNIGVITHVALSPDGKYLAIYAKENETAGRPAALHVVSPDFRNHYIQCKVGAYPPEQVVFCGPVCIMMVWKREEDDSSVVLLVDCFGYYAPFIYEGPVRVVQETDECTRLFTNYSCEIIERVHSSTVDVFKIGSLEPCSLLYDAYSEYTNQKSTTVKTIREIIYPKGFVFENDSEMKGIDRLQDAIDQCVEAACRENNPETQENLLKAAAYGKVFLHGNEAYQINKKRDKNDFKIRCNEIRVLNEVRKYEYGIAITYDQFKELSISSLIGRLVELHHHQLAFKICKDFKLEQEAGRVLVHWACTKVNNPSVEDTERSIQFLVNEIMEKFKNSTQEDKKKEEGGKKEEDKSEQNGSSNISFAEIAMTAYRAGRPKLAKQLLEKDSKPVDQVPLYLSMHEIKRALNHATGRDEKTGEQKKSKVLDSDLVYLIILYLLSIYKQEPMYMYELISEFPEAIRLFVNLCKTENLQQLENYYTQTGNAHFAGMTLVLEAYRNHSKNIDAFKNVLEKAYMMFETAKGASNVDKALTEHHGRLLNLQKRLEEVIEEKRKQDPSVKKIRFVGMNLHDTMYLCVLNGLEDKAEKLRERFNVSDKRFWTVMIKALAKRKAWKALFEFYEKNAIRTTSSPFSFLYGSSTKVVSPVGFAPFVDACLDEGANEEALKYIPLVEDLAVKVKYYIRLGKFKEAIQAAGDAGDIGQLTYIKTQTKNVKTHETIDDVIDQLTGHKKK